MEFNDRFFEELGKSSGVTSLVKRKTQDVARIAIATAPVDTGAYRDLIEVRVKTARYRNVGLVVGTDWKTLLVEAKTHNLVRALRQAKGG